MIESVTSSVAAELPWYYNVVSLAYLWRSCVPAVCLSGNKPPARRVSESDLAKREGVVLFRDLPFKSGTLSSSDQAKVFPCKHMAVGYGEGVESRLNPAVDMRRSREILEAGILRACANLCTALISQAFRMSRVREFAALSRLCV